MRPQSWLLLFLWMLGMPFAAGAWTLASDSDAPNPTPTPAVTTLTYEQHIQPTVFNVMVKKIIAKESSTCDFGG